MSTMLEKIKEIETDIDILNLYSEWDTFEELEEKVIDWISSEEIIFYFKAIEYLEENDPSLKESIQIAIKYWYSLENINSELLATLLYQQELSEEWENIRSDIEYGICRL